MKRLTGALILTLTMVIGGWAFDILTLDSLENLYGPVEFTHEAHMDYAGDCAVCHHFSEEPLACSECHEPLVVYRYRGPERKTGVGLKGAYHGLCLGCHQDVGGPVGCEDCHEKKEVSR